MIPETRTHRWKRIHPDHRSRFAYRYVVAFPGFRAGLNRHGGRVIGIYVVIGRWAYCSTWGAR